MRSFRPQSAAEQVAAHLAEEIQAGEWRGEIPGVKQLTAALGVNHKTVQTALELLEKGGLLVNQGPRRRRRIAAVVPNATGEGATGLRVGILGFEPGDRTAADVGDLMRGLEVAGHRPAFAPKTLRELGHQVEQVARLVGECPADAWVVIAGSRELLQWFSKQPVPVMAYAGRARQVPIASVAPDKSAPLRAAVRRLVGLGHRRIVMLARALQRLPVPGFTERVFLTELEACGIATGPFNLPDWEENAEGFHAGLESLFRFTPPTALIVDEEPFAVAALQFCLQRGLKVPQDVSLMCTDPGPAFGWCHPPLAHIAWTHQLLVKRILWWVDQVGRGNVDRRKTYSKASFVEGGTIGPAPAETEAARHLSQGGSSPRPR